MQNKSTFKKLLFIILLVLTCTSQAQDKKAKALLDEVSAKIKSHTSIVIDFNYSLSNSKENINQDSKGTVILKDNQYVLTFMGVTKIFDGKKN
jgi:outer membrane lipoprotein-sorting protein